MWLKSPIMETLLTSNSSETQYNFSCVYRLRVFHGRISHSFLDDKLGNNPNEQITVKRELAEEIQTGLDCSLTK